MLEYLLGANAKSKEKTPKGCRLRRVSKTGYMINMLCHSICDTGYMICCVTQWIGKAATLKFC